MNRREKARLAKALAKFFDQARLHQVKDPREARGVRYPHTTMLRTLLPSLVCGRTGLQDSKRLHEQWSIAWCNRAVYCSSVPWRAWWMSRSVWTRTTILLSRACVWFAKARSRVVFPMPRAPTSTTLPSGGFRAAMSCCNGTSRCTGGAGEKGTVVL